MPVVLGEVAPARMPHECHKGKEGESRSTEDKFVLQSSTMNSLCIYFRKPQFPMYTQQILTSAISDLSNLDYCIITFKTISPKDSANVL